MHQQKGDIYRIGLGPPVGKHSSLQIYTDFVPNWLNITDWHSQLNIEVSSYGHKYSYSQRSCFLSSWKILTVIWLHSLHNSSSKLNILSAGLIFCARLKCFNCARKSMTNSASLGEMHRTRVSFVRRGVCTQKLFLKMERDSFAVCNTKTKEKKQQQQQNNFLTARPCFIFIVLLSTEDSTAVKIEKGNQNFGRGH